MGSGERVHAFDCLRAFSILCIVLWHAGLAYGEPGLPYWPLHDPTASMGGAFALWYSRGFRLATFFVMSGFFARLVARRTTTRSFVAQRLLRVGVPFVVTLLIYNGLLPHMPGDLARLAPPTGLWPLQQLRPMHLWFLEDLLCISFAVLALSLALPRLLPAAFIARLQRGFGGLLDRWWGPLVPVLFTLPVLLDQGGQYPRSYPGSLAVVPGSQLYWGLFFAFGWLLHAHADKLARLCRHAWSWVAAGLIVRALTLIPLLAGEGWGPNPDFLTRTVRGSESDAALVIVGAELYAWLMVFGLMGVFLRLFRREIPVVRWFADGAYWLYLVHLLPVLLIQWWLQTWLAQHGISLGAGGRFALVAGATLLVCMGSYELCVRYTAVGRLLHGPRTPPPGGRSRCWRWRAPD